MNHGAGIHQGDGQYRPGHHLRLETEGVDAGVGILGFALQNEVGDVFRVGTQSVQRNACCTGSVGPVPGLVLQPCISGVHDIVAAGHSDVLVRHRTSVCSQPALRQLLPHVYGVDYISIIHCLDLSQRSDYIVIGRIAAAENHVNVDALIAGVKEGRAAGKGGCGGVPESVGHCVLSGHADLLHTVNPRLLLRVSLRGKRHLGHLPQSHLRAGNGNHRDAHRLAPLARVCGVIQLFDHNAVFPAFPHEIQLLKVGVVGRPHQLLGDTDADFGCVRHGLDFCGLASAADLLPAPALVLGIKLKLNRGFGPKQQIPQSLVTDTGGGGRCELEGHVKNGRAAIWRNCRTLRENQLRVNCGELRQLGHTPDALHSIGSGGSVRNALQLKVIGGAAGQIQSTQPAVRIVGEGDDHLPAARWVHGNDSLAVINHPVPIGGGVRSTFCGLFRLAAGRFVIQADMGSQGVSQGVLSRRFFGASGTGLLNVVIQLQKIAGDLLASHVLNALHAL